MADKLIYDFGIHDIKRIYFHNLREEQIKKIHFADLEEEQIYQKINNIYEKFLSYELPKISTDFEEEGSGVKRAVINNKITKFYNYPHPEKGKLIYIRISGHEESVDKCY